MKRLRLLLISMVLAASNAWAQPVTDGLQVRLAANEAAFVIENNQVFFWGDLSLNGNNATHDPANNFNELRPILVQSNPTLSGEPTIRFNGNNALELDLSFLANSDYTIFVVNGRDRFGLANFYIAGQSGFANQNLVLGYEQPGLLRHAHFANDLDVAVTPYTGQQIWAIDSFRFSQTDGKDIFQNGANVASDDSTAPLISNFGTTLGHFRAIPGFFFVGDLAEVIIYDRALSTAERQLVEADLAERYNLPLVVEEESAPEIDRDALLGVSPGSGDLIWIDPLEAIGNFIGTGVGGIEALAKSPISGTLYGGELAEELGPVDPVFSYATSISLEFDSTDSSPVNGIDNLEILFSTSVTSGNIGAPDLETLVFRFLDGDVEVATDVAILDNTPQPIGGAARTFNNIFFDYSLDTQTLSQIVNADNAAIQSSSGIQYQVTDSVAIPVDGLLIFFGYDNGDPFDDAEGAVVTQDTQLLGVAGGASLYTLDERSGEASQVGPFGAGILGMRAADFDASGTLWAVVDVFGDDNFEALATIDLETGAANVIGAIPSVQNLDGISFDDEGNLFGVSSSNDGLYLIGTDDGAVTTEIIGVLFTDNAEPIPAGGFRSLQFACDDTPFGEGRGTLYAGLGEEDGDGGRLFVIDPELGVASEVGEGSLTEGESLSGLALHTSCGTSISQAPTPTGTNVKVVTAAAFEQVASNVVEPGLTDAFFCVLPDTRWTPDGSGGFNFSPVNLNLGSLAGQGTCNGDLVPGQPEQGNWVDDIFPNLDLVVAPWFRSYFGEVTLPGVGPTEGHWLALAVIRSTAEYDGAVAYTTFPEALIDFSIADPNETPDCDRDLNFRNLDLGGAVPAFGDFANYEGNRMIVQSGQCNRVRSITRRTTHVFPVRYEPTRGRGPRAELPNLYAQISGIRGTIQEASACLADASQLAPLQATLSSAQLELRSGNYANAEQLFEQIAFIGRDIDYAGCEVGSPRPNYRGNFISRGITAAFSVHDRFEHPNVFVKYFVPPGLDIPLLDEEPIAPPIP